MHVDDPAFRRRGFAPNSVVEGFSRYRLTPVCDQHAQDPLLLTAEQTASCGSMKLESPNFETTPRKGEVQSFSFYKLSEPPLQFLRTPGFLEKIVATGEIATHQKLHRSESYKAAARCVDTAFYLLLRETLIQKQGSRNQSSIEFAFIQGRR